MTSKAHPGLPGNEQAGTDGSLSPKEGLCPNSTSRGERTTAKMLILPKKELRLTDVFAKGLTPGTMKVPGAWSRGCWFCGQTPARRDSTRRQPDCGDPTFKPSATWPLTATKSERTEQAFLLRCLSCFMRDRGFSRTPFGLIKQNGVPHLPIKD
eukprot:XP_022268439.1 uncharacterized protein LOC111093311 isoform X2 [Canis lupus familiaris]